MLIYVFRSSKLRKSACPKSSLSGGNVTCAVEGTSAFNNQCASKIIIQTFSMQLELNGTWLKVSYLPDQQLSVVEVWEGSATVWPVLDAEGYTLGDAVEVDEGKSWITVPDDVLEEMEGLPLRKSLDSLPPQIGDLVQPWQELALARAEDDAVSPPPPPGVQVYLMSGGDYLEESRVREAIRYAVPWAEVAQVAFPDRDAPISMAPIELGGVSIKPELIVTWEVNDARSLDYDPERTKMLLAEAGYPEDLFLRLMYEPDEELAVMAEMIAASLREIGMEVELYVPTVEELSENSADGLAIMMVNAGKPVLWLSRQ
jgi:hypothetical protein